MQLCSLHQFIISGSILSLDVSPANSLICCQDQAQVQLPQSSQFLKQTTNHVHWNPVLYVRCLLVILFPRVWSMMQHLCSAVLKVSVCCRALQKGVCAHAHVNPDMQLLCLSFKYEHDGSLTWERICLRHGRQVKVQWWSERNHHLWEMRSNQFLSSQHDAGLTRHSTAVVLRTLPFWLFDCPFRETFNATNAVLWSSFFLAYHYPSETLTECIGHDIGSKAFSTLLVIAHGEVQP